ncbi:MAG: hypothetical protein B7Z77_07545 [Acidocella sp. 20-58-15]|nr:MAG: hypothetical protein B7Z77_07545 [Acidocella sp. 20-58-15]
MIGGMIAVAPPAFAQPANLLEPLSQQSPSASAQTYQPSLAAAHDAVEKHQWSAAAAELEQSETFLLNGGIKSPNGVVTSPSPAMAYVIRARTAVEQRDQVDALLSIDKAMSTMVPLSGSGSPVALAQVTAAPAPSVATISPVPAAVATPMVTKAMLPGHWQLTGWQYHWVPPDTNYRTVQSDPFIPGHYEYRGGAWIWVAGHYAKATS